MDVLSTIFGTAGLIIGIICYEMDILENDLVYISNEDYEQKNKIINLSENKRFNNKRTYYMRWGMFICTILSIVFMLI